MSKIPSRQTLAGIGGNPLYVPMDGDGNATVPGRLTVGGVLTVNANSVLNGAVAIGQDATVAGDLGVTGTLDALSADLKQGLNINSTNAIDGNCTLQSPGIFVGNGSGLTNLPPATVPIAPDFFFQSEAINWGVLPVNRMVPEVEEPVPYVAIQCDLVGKAPGIYMWKTDANILVQQIWNSASGLVYWDGTKVSGQTTWSLIQDENVDNPEYFLTWSYLFFVSLTGFYVQIESSYGTVPVDPLQYDHYYVNFYKIGDISGGATPLPTPTGVAVSAITDASATVTWTQVPGYTYTVYLTQGATVKAYTAGQSGSLAFPTARAVGPVPALTANTPYSVTVQAQLSVQTSAQSSPVSFTTLT
jgi:hypothetical protein